MANLEALKVRRDDVVLILSNAQAKDLLNTLTTGTASGNTASLLTPYLRLVIAQAEGRDRDDFIAGVSKAIASLNDEPEVTGLDLWHEHRGTVRVFDPTDQDPT